MADVITFIVMLAIYSAVMIYIGYRGYKATKNVQDWLVAGRRIGPLVVAMSYGATFISAVAIIGFAGQAQVYGMQLLWLSVLNIIVGILIAFIIFGNRTRIMSKTLQALTFTELLGKRFNSRFVKALAALSSRSSSLRIRPPFLKELRASFRVPSGHRTRRPSSYSP